MRQIEREEEKQMEGDLSQEGEEGMERKSETARTRERSAGAKNERDDKRRPR